MYCYMISTRGAINSFRIGYYIKIICRQGKLAGTCILISLGSPAFECSNDAILPQSTCTTFKCFSLWTVKTQVVENLTVLDLQKSTSNTCILYLYYEIKNKHALHVTGLIVVACEYSYLYFPNSKECSLLYSNSDSFDISGQTWWKQSQGNSEEVER